MQTKLKVIERKLGREGAWGQAVSGESLIEVDPRQPPKEYLDTILHEAMHIIEPDWSEGKVSVTARKLSELVWGMGYRRCFKGTVLLPAHLYPDFDVDRGPVRNKSRRKKQPRRQVRRASSGR